MTTISVESAAGREGFEVAITAVLNRLRSSLSVLIEGVAAKKGPVRSAADLQRALGIRNTLVWQVYRLAQAPDPLSEVGGLPGETAMRHFFKAAGAAGVSNQSIGAAQDALQELEALVQTHAGDRATFQSMVSGLSQNRSSQIDANQKRAAFRANSHLWGVQARVQLSCFVYQPSHVAPNQIDAAGIRGLVDLRRLRHNVPWVVTSTRAADDDGVVRRDVGIEPLDPGGAIAQGVCLMNRFCSDPLPALRSEPAPGGKTNITLEPNGIGAASELTCIVGNIFRRFCPLEGDAHNDALNCQSTVRTPCEYLIHDVLIHESIAGQMLSEALTYGDHRDVDPSFAGRDCDLLALREPVVHAGKGLGVLHTPQVPRYVDMLTYAFEQLAWNAEQFDVYRCRMEYPVMPSSVVTQYRFPGT